MMNGAVSKPGSTDADMTACWSCTQALAARAPFCHSCGAVQPPRTLDHFARLGLPATFPTERAALDRQYFGLQRHLHPDRFARKSPKERALSQQQAAALNEAYEALKDPLRSAAYLAGLRGVELPTDGKTVADPELLVEAMEAREALQDAATAEDVETLAADARTKRDAALLELPVLFAKDDRPGLRRAIFRLRYLEKFSEEARVRRTNLAGGTR
jgi:molecular chaperone HscB